ncbi:hypothetical protein SLS53_006937 [Cytospora paraplurivora]|uniref:Arylamine N-acetyltransferase n=1 Tax=Cytospora paraplurivora TaxID=2898453 RepID=A0AAN9U8U9_9PEZI
MATYTEDQLNLYLQHINYPRSRHPADPVQFLTELEKHHLCRVPFDSVALHYSPHRLLSLDPDDLFQKIVVNSRGGYCMEVNTLFATVLRSLGFELYSAGARVKHERWNHMVNLVTIDGKKYLVDVGFGAREPTEPVPLVRGYEFINIAPRKGRLEFRHLARHGDTEDPTRRVWVYSARKDDGAEWEEMYSFTETEFFPEDFEVMNYFVMTTPQSYFVQTVVAYRPMMSKNTGPLVGECILHKDVVKQGEAHGDRILNVLKSEDDRVKALQDYFSICLTEKEKKGIRGLATELKN